MDIVNITRGIIMKDIDFFELKKITRNYRSDFHSECPLKCLQNFNPKVLARKVIMGGIIILK